MNLQKQKSAKAPRTVVREHEYTGDKQNHDGWNHWFENNNEEARRQTLPLPTPNTRINITIKMVTSSHQERDATRCHTFQEVEANKYERVQWIQARERRPEKLEWCWGTGGGGSEWWMMWADIGELGRGKLNWSLKGGSKDMEFYFKSSGILWKVISLRNRVIWSNIYIVCDCHC